MARDSKVAVAAEASLRFELGKEELIYLEGLQPRKSPSFDLHIAESGASPGFLETWDRVKSACKSPD